MTDGQIQRDAFYARRREEILAENYRRRLRSSRILTRCYTERRRARNSQEVYDERRT